MRGFREKYWINSEDFVIPAFKSHEISTNFLLNRRMARSNHPGRPGSHDFKAVKIGNLLN